MKTITRKTAFQNLKDVSIGKGVRLFHFINAYRCQIGDYTKIGSFVEIQKRVVIGQKCKISSHSFLCEGVKLGDGVFIGHNVTFINDKYPKATSAKGDLLQEGEWELVQTIVEDNVSVGSSSTILCGIVIGKNSLIGAGAVVTKDVPPNSIVVGNPARILHAKRK